MVSIRHKYLILASCVLLSLWLLFAQALGSLVFLLPCLGAFLVLAVWAAVKGMAVPILMYFLPFSPLLKIVQGSTSFFTIALLAVYLVYCITGSRNVKVYHMIPGLCIIALTMVVKVAYGYSFSNSYILFAASLLLVPFISRELNDKYDFFLLTLFFTLGIALAAFSARYMLLFPNVTQFITTHTLYGSTRYSGYYGDPNFYSAHVTAALSGVLLLMLKSRTLKRTVFLTVMAVVLLYCGMVSLSKMFFLLVLCLFLIWFLMMLFQKGKLSPKITMVLVVIVGAGILLSSTVLTDAVDAIVARFGRDSNISDFTTGRSEVWIVYLKAFFENPVLLLFGQGITSVLVGEKSTHNTVIQCVFQLGLVGSSLLLAWIVCYFNNLMESVVVKRGNGLMIVFLLIGMFGPWMALDMFFFDEFFLMPIYMSVGIGYLRTQNPAAVGSELE